MTYQNGMIAVWFSRGAASAVALKLTIERFGKGRVRAVTNPVVEERPDNVRFERDVAEWAGVEIEHVTNPKYPSASAVDVWEARKGMAFPHGAPCTAILKKEARQLWELENKPSWHVLGFTADERKRHERFTLTERENVIPVLIDAGMTKWDCTRLLTSAGIDLPDSYALGFPNANCMGCVKATSPTYWNLVRKVDPQAFQARAEQSRRLGARLVRVAGQRIFLDELDPKAKGMPLKSMPDCGTFCEET